MAQGFSERIHWSTETWPLDEFAHRFGNQFPIIVNTVSGFYGANEVEVISAGEILRVDSLVSQRRMFARDVRGRIFSLPLNLPLRFEAIKGNGRRSRPKRLAELLDDYELPIRVAFAANEKSSFSVGEMRYDSGKLGTLSLYKLYEETFLRVNSIARGAIDKNVLMMPLYVQIQVSLAKGFRDGHSEDWESLMKMYDRSIGQSKIMTISGLDDVLVYDPADTSVIVNPQAREAETFRQDARATSMLIKDFESSKGHDSMTTRLSAFKIGGSKEGNRLAKSLTEYRDNTANILRYGNKNDVNLAMTDLRVSDEFVLSSPETRKRNKERNLNSSSNIQKSRSSKIILSPEDEDIYIDHEYNQRTVLDKEHEVENETSAEARVEIRDRKALDVVPEELRLEENQRDVRSSRPKPLERPILAKRTSAPTGRVSPMVKTSENTIQPAAIVLNIEDIGQTEELGNGEIAITRHKERQPNKTLQNDTEVTEQETPFSDSEIIDIRKMDDRRSSALQRFSQSTDDFADSPMTQRPASRSKKSALKAGRKKSTTTRAKRHVSYSDTDTVYPLDSHDDLAADDSELDGPFFHSNAPSIFADNWRSRSVMVHESRNAQTLPMNRRRQTGSLVVNVLPVQSSVRNKHSLGMNRAQFNGSDSNILAKFSTASFRYPSVGVIPETLEEYQTVPTVRQYDAAASRVRIGDLDTSRKYGRSVVNVGNVRSEGGLSIRNKRMEPAIISVGDAMQSDALTRRSANYRAAAASNRKPVFERKQDVIPSGRRQDHKMMTTMNTTGQNRNGSTVGQPPPPPPDYGQPLYNFTSHPIRTFDNHKTHFGGKMIRLNETRDGNVWDEIFSDYEVDQHSRKGMTSVRLPDSNNYLINSATMGRYREGSNGIDFISSPPPALGKYHMTHVSTPGVVSTVAFYSPPAPDRGRGGLQGRAMTNGEIFSAGTMPRIYKDNQNVIRQIGVVAPNVVLVRK